eukprot:GABV01008986.1.p3 GENE.GABV01008986.1~~GABV01008986.1.p3  ORF type:complete len:144 (+),score=59.13 GABV01008986.1:433-864(+)
MIKQEFRFQQKAPHIQRAVESNLVPEEEVKAFQAGLMAFKEEVAAISEEAKALEGEKSSAIFEEASKLLKLQWQQAQVKINTKLVDVEKYKKQFHEKVRAVEEAQLLKKQAQVAEAKEKELLDLLDAEERAKKRRAKARGRKK